MQDNITVQYTTPDFNRKSVIVSIFFVSTILFYFVFQMKCPGTPVSSTNNTDRHDITEILLKVASNIIPHPPNEMAS
jgi:hypothetical protein